MLIHLYPTPLFNTLLSKKAQTPGRPVETAEQRALGCPTVLHYMQAGPVIVILCIIMLVTVILLNICTTYYNTHFFESTCSCIITQKIDASKSSSLSPIRLYVYVPRATKVILMPLAQILQIILHSIAAQWPYVIMGHKDAEDTWGSFHWSVSLNTCHCSWKVSVL